MPLYDFLCRACGLEFEALVMGGRPPACPHCGSSDLQKRMSSFSARTGGRSPSENTGAGSKCSGCGGGNCGTCH